MGEHFIRTWCAAALAAGLLLGLSACTLGAATDGPNGPEATQPVNRAMEVLLVLVPGQSTEQQVQDELGEPGGTEEPLLGEWTWLYPLSDGGESFVRVTLDTSSTLRLVKSVQVIQPSMTIGDLTAAIGEPDLIYEDLANQWSVLAYPVLGIEAVVIGNFAQAAEPIISLRRGPAESVQSFLDGLEARSDVRIVKMP